VPTRASFQSLADKLINNTFSDFRDVVTLSQVDFDYDTQLDTVIASDTTKGIRLEFDKSQFNGSSIQVGDYKIVMVQQGLTVDIRADNVKMTFNGVDVSIVSVSEDAARAAYTLQVRAK
jgi:hypothetical protein